MEDTPKNLLERLMWNFHLEEGDRTNPQQTCSYHADDLSTTYLRRLWEAHTIFQQKPLNQRFYGYVRSRAGAFLRNLSSSNRNNQELVQLQRPHLQVQQPSASPAMFHGPQHPLMAMLQQQMMGMVGLPSMMQQQAPQININNNNTYTTHNGDVNNNIVDEETRRTAEETRRTAEETHRAAEETLRRMESMQEDQQERQETLEDLTRRIDATTQDIDGRTMSISGGVRHIVRNTPALDRTQGQRSGDGTPVQPATNQESPQRNVPRPTQLGVVFEDISSDSEKLVVILVGELKKFVEAQNKKTARFWSTQHAEALLRVLYDFCLIKAVTCEYLEDGTHTLRKLDQTRAEYFAELDILAPQGRLGTMLLNMATNEEAVASDVHIKSAAFDIPHNNREMKDKRRLLPLPSVSFSRQDGYSSIESFVAALLDVGNPDNETAYSVRALMMGDEVQSFLFGSPDNLGLSNDCETWWDDYGTDEDDDYSVTSDDASVLASRKPAFDEDAQKTLSAFYGIVAPGLGMLVVHSIEVTLPRGGSDSDEADTLVLHIATRSIEDASIPLKLTIDALLLLDLKYKKISIESSAANDEGFVKVPLAETSMTSLLHSTKVECVEFRKLLVNENLTGAIRMVDGPQCIILNACMLAPQDRSNPDHGKSLFSVKSLLADNVKPKIPKLVLMCLDNKNTPSPLEFLENLRSAVENGQVLQVKIMHWSPGIEQNKNLKSWLLKHKDYIGDDVGKIELDDVAGFIDNKHFNEKAKLAERMEPLPDVVPASSSSVSEGSSADVTGGNQFSSATVDLPFGAELEMYVPTYGGMWPCIYLDGEGWVAIYRTGKGKPCHKCRVSLKEHGKYCSFARHEGNSFVKQGN
mmetsp:Transcript_25793/g.45475  ORF Transcript_25793/g.45475 Transcript_25793/m.45475 type:complete len:865 (+) Transcript_25793:39-2633(+)